MTKLLKAISLYSGGLDSILAIETVLAAATEKIEIIPIKLITPFFNFKTVEEEKKEIDYIKRRFGFELRLIDITDDFLKILDAPKYGYGKNLNPCVDCKILMLKKAKEIMEKNKALFIFTGEVAGQRPKSQKIDKLRIIEKEAGLDDYLLRPLSAKLLKETLAEKNGIIDRNKLFDISGRSRNRQLKMAKFYNIEYFATPSGGCLLTDPEYARKLKIIKEKFHVYNHLLNFLRWGRIFLIDEHLFIVGRNDFENRQILKLVSEDDLLLQPLEIPGPLCVILGGAKVLGYHETSKILNTAASICVKFTVKENKKIKVQYGLKNKEMEKIEELIKLRLENTLITEPLGNLVRFQI